MLDLTDIDEQADELGPYRSALRNRYQLAAIVEQGAATVTRVRRRLGFNHLGLEGIGAPPFPGDVPFLVVDLANRAGSVAPQRVAAAGVADRVHPLPGPCAIA